MEYALSNRNRILNGEILQFYADIFSASKLNIDFEHGPQCKSYICECFK